VSDAFGPGALRLVGVMARLAGWPPDRFWQSTPADVAAVLAGWTCEDGAGEIDREALAVMMEVFPDGG
jgi:uncharacterized phage protein (TIGR02216 family)